VHIAILQFDLLIPGAGSLKDKRRVVRSVRDRLHREHQVSVAEVAYLDRRDVAGMGLAAVSRDARYLAGLLDRITGKLRGLHDAELGEVRREILSGTQLPSDLLTDEGEPLWRPDEARAREEAAE